MNTPAPRHILTIQCTLALLAAGLVLVAFPDGGEAALAALYGGAVPPLVTLISAWRTGRASLAGVGGGMVQLYLGIAERYGLVVVLLGAGFAVLELAAGPMVLVFAAGQLLGPAIAIFTVRDRVQYP